MAALAPGRLYLATAVGLFVGFSGIQQTLGFQLQDKLQLSGIETAQMTGAALLISAVFTFLIQVTVMQRTSLKATWLIRLGLASLCVAAIIITASGSFVVLGTGMAFLGAGMFLRLNGFRLTATQHEATLTMLALAASDITEAAYADWLRNHTTPLTKP